MSKELENNEVKTVDGYLVKISEIDADGMEVFEDEAKKIKKLRVARVSDLYRIAAISIPQSIHTPNDGHRIAQLLSSIDKMESDKLILHDKIYDWIKRLLNRQLPATKEAKEAGVGTGSYAYALWGANDWFITQQLRLPEDRELLFPEGDIDD